MNRFKIAALCCIVMLAGCQQAEEIESPSEKLPMSVVASIGESSRSRYVSGNDAGTPDELTFATGDEIGIFVNDLEAVKWTNTESGWSAGTTVYWPNETQKHKFYAFYPFPAEVPNDLTKTKVPMPSLENQMGTVESLSNCDFLVAAKEQSYGTEGKVSFTGEGNSFEHINSLVSITILKESDLKMATINKISFEGDETGIASSSTYSFMTEEVTVVTTNDKMESGNLGVSMVNATGDKILYFILNSGAKLSDITFSIEYTIDGVSFTASKTGLGSGNLTSGNRYNFKLNITDGVLNISGAEIEGWGAGEDMGDIVINTPQQGNS